VEFKVAGAHRNYKRCMKFRAFSRWLNNSLEIREQNKPIYFGKLEKALNHLTFVGVVFSRSEMRKLKPKTFNT